MDNYKEKIAAWLIDEDLEVKSEPIPTGAPIEWALRVSVKAPVRVSLVLQQPSTKKDRIVATMGATLSDVHRRELFSLPEARRVEIVTEIFNTLISMCPDCLVFVQPSFSNPTAIAITKIIYHETLSRDSIASTVRLLANAFAVIVSLLNSRLKTAARPEREGVEAGFM
ncbi:MAG: DUF2299 domain-containing protein [Desulfurococcales archaeon]|nr:DUF2299 domain-containing protein [Desulfurococcales archaeon]